MGICGFGRDAEGKNRKSDKEIAGTATLERTKAW